MEQSKKRNKRRKLKKQADAYFNEPEVDDLFSESSSVEYPEMSVDLISDTSDLIDSINVPENVFEDEIEHAYFDTMEASETSFSKSEHEYSFQIYFKYTSLYQKIINNRWWHNHCKISDSYYLTYLDSQFNTS